MRHEWWDEVNTDWGKGGAVTKANFNKAVRDKPIFMNVNDVFSHDPDEYEQQIGWFHDAMEQLFPSPKTRTGDADSVVVDKAGRELAIPTTPSPTASLGGWATADAPPSQCVFPFTYNGVSYTTCTSDVVPWCAFDAVVHSPLDATRWSNCPTTPDPTDAPSELDQGSCEPSPGFTDAPWYADYSSHVRMVRPPDAHTHSEFMSDACARWWHPSPQRSYEDYSLRPWSGILRSRTMETKWRPRCSFGQALLTETKCASSQRQLIAALDAARVVYFPRSGTELGIVRGSQYLSEDGDLDIYVDMPQTMLYDKLQSELSPPPYLSGSGVTAAVQWAVPNCPEVHLVYNDWISDELQHRAKPSDLCLCRLNSLELLCHKDGAKRMYTQYGPSWIVPLGVKKIDMPHWAIRSQKDGGALQIERHGEPIERDD